MSSSSSERAKSTVLISPLMGFTTEHSKAVSAVKLEKKKKNTKRIDDGWRGGMKEGCIKMSDA